MRRIPTLCGVLVAMLALGAFAAASASAAQWLANGAKITTAQSAITEGKWLLLGLSFFGAIKTHVACSGKLIGTVGPEGNDQVKSVEGLKKEVNTITCEVLSGELGGCTGSTLALVTAEHLPWKSVLSEPKAGEIIDTFESAGLGKPAFAVECTLSNGSKSTELCEGNVKSDPFTNLEGGGTKASVLNSLSEKCNTGGTVSHVYAEGTTKLLSGSLSVSK